MSDGEKMIFDECNGQKQERVKSNKKLCIVATVYGNTYQGWIPVYILSILQNCPDYDVRIYLEHCLRPDIRDILDQFNNQTRFSIVENVIKDYPYFVTDMEKRSIRWMLNDEVLRAYQYIYIGDVDIYIIREDIPLLEQHVRHMHKTGLPYSNEIRMTIFDILINKTKDQHRSLINWRKLTGLHFFETEKYFSGIEKSQRLLADKLSDKNLSNIEYIYLKKFVLVDDERTLFYLVKNAGFKMPKYSQLICEGKHDKCFRPEHGLHFAIGRMSDSYHAFVDSDEKRGDYNRMKSYRQYFGKFMQDYNQNSRLRKVINQDEYVKQVVYKTCGFFGYSMTENDIEENANR